MNEKKFSVICLVIFILSLVTIGLLGFAMIQPIVASTNNDTYLTYIKSFIEDFPTLFSSSEKDKLFTIIIVGLLLALMGLGALFTAISVLVILISGISSLFGKTRIKTRILLVASGFNLAFLSILSTTFYHDGVSLALGGLLIIASTGLAIVLHGLEDYFFGRNKTVRHLIGSIMRMAISCGYVFIGVHCFSRIFKEAGGTVEFSQYVYSDVMYLATIEEDLPKRLLSIIPMAIFILSSVAQIFISLLPAICAPKRYKENVIPKNQSGKYIAQSIIMAIIIAGTYFGSIYTSGAPENYAMGSGLIFAGIILGAAFVLAIVAAIVDPRAKLEAEMMNDSPSAPQQGASINESQPQPRGNVNVQEEAPQAAAPDSQEIEEVQTPSVDNEPEEINSSVKNDSQIVSDSPSDDDGDDDDGKNHKLD